MCLTVPVFLVYFEFVWIFCYLWNNWRLSLSFLLALKCYDSVIWGEMKRFFCHFLSLKEERADGEQTGPRQPENLQQHLQWGKEQWGVLHSVCALLCYFMRVSTRLNQMLLWNWDSDLFSNCYLTDSSPKVYSKYWNSFRFLSARALKRGHFYQQKW